MKMVCTRKHPWNCDNGYVIHTPGPQYEEIVTVIGAQTMTGRLRYFIAEHDVDTDGCPVVWDARYFRPIQHDEQKACDQSFLALFNKQADKLTTGN